MQLNAEGFCGSDPKAEIFHGISPSERAFVQQRNRVKTRATEWEKIFASYSSDKGISCRIASKWRSESQPNLKRANIFPNGEHQKWPTGTPKTPSLPCKTKLWWATTSLRRDHRQNVRVTGAGKEAEKGLLAHRRWEWKLVQPLQKTVRGLLTV